MYRILVEEVIKFDDGEPQGIKRFEQTVDVLDMPKLIATINQKPRKKREPKQK